MQLLDLEVCQSKARASRLGMRNIAVEISRQKESRSKYSPWKLLCSGT